MIEVCKRPLPLTESALAILVVNPSIVSLPHYYWSPGSIPSSPSPESGFGGTQSTPTAPRGSLWSRGGDLNTHQMAVVRPDACPPASSCSRSKDPPSLDGSGARRAPGHNEGHSQSQAGPLGAALSAPMCNNQGVVLSGPGWQAGHCLRSVGIGLGVLCLLSLG